MVALPETLERGSFFRLQVYERVGISSFHWLKYMKEKGNVSFLSLNAHRG